MKRKNNLYLFFILGLGIFFNSCSPATEEQEHTQMNFGAAKKEVQQVLDQQADCWSKGDLTCYMEGYWKSDSLVFVGKSGLTYGWQPTLDNYKRNYPDPAAMGKLTFDILKMDTLSEETILVIGKWHLKREVVEGDLQGHFSVVFKRFEDGWKVIADHSS